MTYQPFNTQVDADAFLADILDALDDTIPNYTASPANPEVLLASAFAHVAQDLAQQLSGYDDEIFIRFGESIARIGRLASSPAIGRVAITCSDADGHRIPADTYLYATKEDETVAFRTTTEVLVPQGSSSVPNVSVVAVEPGSFANGISGELKPLDAIAFLSAITLLGPTEAGEDGESEAEYLARLSEELTIASPTPVVPRDFEILARRIPEVGRALALDNYDSDTDTDDVERTVSLFLTDDDGEIVDPLIHDQVKGYLNSLRETNFLVRTADPTYTTVTVATELELLPDYDAPSVLASVGIELETYLSPVAFGSGSNISHTPVWFNEKKVRLFNVAQTILNTPGVASITSLTLNGSAADVTLSGKVGLVRSGTHVVEES